MPRRKRRKRRAAGRIENGGGAAPATVAGVAERLREMSDIVDAVEAAEPAPAKRGSHGKRAAPMNRHLPQLIIMISGAVLIVVGIVVVLQMGETNFAQSPAPSRSIQTSPSGAITLTTTYVGLVVIVIGAALEIVGYLGATPWRRRETPDSRPHSG